jgi:hypothetical protein
MSKATPLEISQYERARYRRDPEYRLKRINHTRALRGRPLVASLDEINPRGEFRDAR